MQENNDFKKNRFIEFLNNVDVEKINDWVKFVTSIMLIIMSALTLQIELSRDLMGTRARDFFNLPKHFFIENSNKTIIKLYYLIVCAIFLALILKPILSKVIIKNSSIRKSEVVFDSRIIGLLTSYILFGRLYYIVLKFNYLYNFILALVSSILCYILCKKIIWEMYNYLYESIEDDTRKKEDNINFIKDIFSFILEGNNKYLILYPLIFVYLVYALFSTFFSVPEMKNIREYELICGTKDIKDGKDYDVVIKTINDGNAIIMKGSVSYKEHEEGKLIIDNSSYKLEPLENKNLKFHVFDEVSTTEIEDAKK